MQLRAAPLNGVARTNGTQAREEEGVRQHRAQREGRWKVGLTLQLRRVEGEGARREAAPLARRVRGAGAVVLGSCVCSASNCRAAGAGRSKCCCAQKVAGVVGGLLPLEVVAK
jgi:hypothetical protein